MTTTMEVIESLMAFAKNEIDALKLRAEMVRGEAEVSILRGELQANMKLLDKLIEVMEGMRRP